MRVNAGTPRERRQVPEGERPGGGPVERDPADQTQSPEDMNQQIAEAGGYGARLAAQPHEERGGHGHELPEQEQRQEVPGEAGSERRARVRQRRHVLRGVIHVKRVDHPDEREESEDVRKDQAEAIDAAEDELLSQEGNRAVDARLHQDAVDQSEGRQQHHRDASAAASEQRQQPGARDQHEPRVYPLRSHSSLPAA